MQPLHFRACSRPGRRRALFGLEPVRATTSALRTAAIDIAEPLTESSISAATRTDWAEFGVTASRGLAGRYLDGSMEVRCVRK